MEIIIPLGFESGYVTENDPIDPATELLVSIADEVSNALVPDLIKFVANYADIKNIPKRISSEVDKISKTFQDNISPTSERQSLTDILNAGWLCMLDRKLWKDVSQIKSDKNRVLNDLLLKSMEVSEVLQRLEKTP